MRRSPTRQESKSSNNFVRVWREAMGWSNFWSLLAGITTLSFSISSLLHGWFGFRLIPILETPFQTLQNFVHGALEIIFYSWATWVLERSWLLLTTAISWFSQLTPVLPSIDVPGWWKDLALISIILLRAESRAMGFARPLSTHAMTAEERSQWEKSRTTIPVIAKLLIALFWTLVLIIYRVSKVFQWTAKFVLRSSQFGRAAYLLFGGVMMLGIAFFLHDIALGVGTRKLRDQPVNQHRQFLVWVTFSILLATGASLLFFLVNGALMGPLSNQSTN